MEKVIRQFDSAVVISLDTGWTVRVSNPGKGERFFFFIICPYRLWGPSRLIFSGYRRSLFSVKAAGPWTEPLPRYSAEIKNEWSYTSTPPACLHGVDRDSLPLTVIFRSFLDYSILSMFIALSFLRVYRQRQIDGHSHFDRRPARSGRCLEVN